MLKELRTSRGFRLHSLKTSLLNELLGSHGSYTTNKNFPNLNNVLIADDSQLGPLHRNLFYLFVY